MNNRSNLESQSPSRQQLKALLCELFLEIRTKLDEGSQIYLSRIVPIDEDKSVIMNAEFSTVLHYLNQITSYLITQKHDLEQIIEKKNSDECSDYESCLQKLEAEVRQHIRIEQQLKLYAETTQEKLEQITKEKDDLELKFKNVNLDQIKQIEKTNVQIGEQLTRKEEEFKQLQQQYNQKTDQLNEQEQTIQQLKAQIQQLQISQQQQMQNNQLTNSQWIQQQQSLQPSFNSHLIQGDSQLSSKMVSVNPNLQSNQSSEICFIDAKRGKRSVSSMNEDTIKKYTQFSQSSQINPQQILSSSSQIQYNTQNKNLNVNLNAEQIGENPNTRMYTDPHVQERSSSRLGNVAEMKENRKSFDKYASSIQEKLLKKDGQTVSYYNENSSNNSNSGNLNNNSYKNIHNNMINSKTSHTASTLTSASQNNNRQNVNSIGQQKQTQNQVQMPPVVSNNTNNSAIYLNNQQKQKSTQPQPSNQLAQGYLQQSGVQYANVSLQQQMYPSQISSQHSSTQQQQQQPNYISGSRIKYTHHQQNASASGLSQTNAIPQSSNLNGTASNQFDGGYQTLDSQRNKQTLANKLSDIQNCLSSRQPNTLLNQPSQTQYLQSQAYSAGLHVRNTSNQSASNINEKQNAMNSSYTQQHPGQYQYNQQQFNQVSVNNTTNLNSSNIKYSPITQQVSYSNTQQLQPNVDLNKSQRSYMNSSSNNINNNNISMNQYSSKEQNNNSTINMNTSQINTSNNNNSNYKGQITNSQINNNQASSNSKYGQYIQSQRPNSSFEKSNPYIQNQKPQQGIIGTSSNPSQNLSINNGQVAYQQSGASNNPRSQSMDGFQKQQQLLNKQGNSQQIQNAYLKQKTASQMQTAEVINNMIKNYKIN